MWPKCAGCKCCKFMCGYVVSIIGPCAGLVLEVGLSHEKFFRGVRVSELWTHVGFRYSLFRRGLGLRSAQHFPATRPNALLVMSGTESPDSKSIWVVVKIMVPVWVLTIIRRLIFRVPKKGP